jgi:serine/threonine-protein kinase
MMLQDLESGWRQSLGPGEIPEYSPSGHIVYGPVNSSDGLWALPFSLESLKATGEPFPIHDNGSRPSFAADGTMVNLDDRSLRQLVWRDRDGEITEKIGVPWEQISYPTLSPNGLFIAFTAREGSRRDVFVWDIARGVKWRVNSGSGFHASPVWSPSGEELAYTATREGNNCDVFLRQADGGGEERALVSTPVCEWVTDWSRDGKHILYEKIMSQPERDLWYLERKEDGSWEPHPFLQEVFWERAGKFSPNGKYVAYLSNESGMPEVYVQPFPGGGGKTMMSSSAGTQAHWSRDGKELYFVNRGRSMTGTLMAARVSTAPGISLSPATALFKSPRPEEAGWISQYDVSVDGQHFLFAEPLGSWEPKVQIVQNWFAAFKDRK